MGTVETNELASNKRVPGGAYSRIRCRLAPSALRTRTEQRYPQCT